MPEAHLIGIAGGAVSGNVEAARLHPPKVRYLVTSGHPGVKPALMRQVAPLAAVLLAHAMTVVPHFASVGIQDSEAEGVCDVADLEPRLATLPIAQPSPVGNWRGIK